jgi:molecular chaperone Hsp33
MSDRDMSIMAAPGDWMRRFHLEQAGVRGVIVQLDAVWREIAGRADYPPGVRKLLGEAIAATTLFAGELKMPGNLSIQLRSQGAVPLLYAECTRDGRVRGLARWRDPVAPTLAIDELGADAMLAITIEREAGNQRYQGLVPVEGSRLAQAFEGYFARSEQLPTLIQLVCEEQRCAGMLLQQVPTVGGQALRSATSEFERAGLLFRTLTDAELVGLDAERILRRLYAEDDVRLHPAQPLAFGCRCSRERVAGVLLALGRDEAEAARGADGQIEVRCEFCNRLYRFDPIDVGQLFAAEPVAPAPPTPH